MHLDYSGASGVAVVHMSVVRNSLVCILRMKLKKISQRGSHERNSRMRNEDDSVRSGQLKRMRS